MSELNEKQIVKVEISVERQAGYKCDVCSVVTIVYNPTLSSPICVNCGHLDTNKIWDHMLKTTTEVSSV